MQSSRKQEKKQSNPLKKPKLGQQQQNHHTVVSEMFISDGSASACYSQNITERLTSTLTLAKSSITLPSKEMVRIIQSLLLYYFLEFSPIMGLAFNISLYLYSPIKSWHGPPLSSTVHAGTDNRQTTSTLTTYQ